MDDRPEAQISCRNLWKVFGSRAKKSRRKAIPRVDGAIRNEEIIAVKDVSFDVHPGEIFVVMGLSGSGKSTLVRCITRLIEPTYGQVFIDGEDVIKMKKSQLRDLRRHRISMVFQQFGLFPHRKVIDNAAYGLEVRGVKKTERLKRAGEMLSLVGLQGWERRYPHELSGGMQQRVGLARALAVNPDILLCDEPFSALDPLIRREMQDELLRLQRLMQKTIIFITHDFLEATKLGDRIAIMRGGEIVQIGTPQQVVANPIDDYVREFAKDVPRSRVLTAQSIMKEDRTAIIQDGTSTCTPHTTLEALIPLIIKGDQSLVVVNDRNEPLGIVDQEMVMLAMAGQG